MRIKRQRRKLRGKYSGNCLSCAAKWSKCWYIASVDNQREWETRLSKTVTPSTDEVCFQCWDAKIRTSPKRKIHFKTELSVLNDSVIPAASASPSSSTRYAKRVDRNKRRAMSGDFDCTIHTSEFSPERSDRDSKAAFGDEETDESYDEDLYDDDSPIQSRIYEESVIFDEENAVILLSTAFRTLPEVNININFNSFHDVDSDDSDKSKRRGAYYCGKCGKLKKGHVCDDTTSPKSEELSCNSPPSSPPLSSISIQVSTTVSQLPIQSTAVDVTLPSMGVFAQPVIS